MKGIYQFFIPLFCTMLFVFVTACEKKTVNDTPGTTEPVHADSVQLKKKTKEIRQETDSPALEITPSQNDSIFSDSVKVSTDIVSDSTETMVQPMRKPTFKHFYKYMKLHNRGPIVMVPFRF